MSYNVVNVTTTVSTGIGRREYIDWINSSLHLGYKSVEEMCTGAAYCQLLEIMFPKTINLKKIKFTSRQEYEYIQNFKSLQAAFSSLKVEKSIPIEKLVKGKFQDNFEFLQWFREFYYQNYDPERLDEGYDPVKARSSSSTGGKKLTVPPSVSKPKGLQPPGLKSSAPRPPQSGQKKVPTMSPQEMTKSSSTSSRPDSVNSELERRLEDAQNQLAETEQKIREYEVYTETFGMDLDQATKEREFYFSKLRKIEVITQENYQEGDQVLEAIQAVLYETEDGFTLPVDEESTQQGDLAYADVAEEVGNVKLDEPHDTY